MKRKSRAILNRSGEKPCDICKEIEPLQAHHINGREVKNYNQDWNVANICAGCHYQVHLGGIIIESWFDTTNGRELIWHMEEEESITSIESKTHIIKINKS